MAAFEETCLLGPPGHALRVELDALVAQGNAAAQLRRAELKMVHRDLAGAIDDVLAAGKSLQSDRIRGPVAELLAARLLNRTLRREAAAEVLAHAKEKAGRGGPRARLALVMTEAEIALDARDFPTSRAHYARAGELAVGPAFAHERMTVLLALATLAQLMGTPAMDALAAALGLARELDDDPARAESAFALANLKIGAGDGPAARQLLAEALATGALAPAMRPVAHSFSSRLALNAGETALALRHAIDGAKAAAAAGNPGGYAEGTILAAHAQLRANQPAAALKTLAAGEKVLRDRGETAFADLVAQERDGLPASTG